MKTALIKAVITRMIQDTGLLIVKADQEGAETPSLPYGIYKVTSPYVKGRGRGNITYESDGEITYEKFSEQPLTTISFSIYADDEDESRELALQVRNWFSFYGSIYLEENDIAIHRLWNVENRTTHIIEHYEYKHGFDVQLRTEEVLMKEIETIEKVELGGL